MSQDQSTTPKGPTPPEGLPARCRGRRRRCVAGALGLTLIAAASLFAFRATGQGEAGPFGHGAFLHGKFCGARSPAEAERHVTRMVGWLVDDVKGTPEQEKRLVEIATAAVKDLAPIRMEACENHAKVVALLTAESIDRAALEAIRSRQMELAAAASIRIAKAVADAAEVLTPAQRAGVADRMAKRWG